MKLIFGDEQNLFEEDNPKITFVNDPIAVALLRNESMWGMMMVEIDSDESCQEFIKQGDFQVKADEIRDYYKKRLFYGALNHKFSNTRFRKDLHKCLEREDVKTLHANEIGMIARLPDFYQEDIARDLIVQECNTGPTEEKNFYDNSLTATYLCKTRSRFGPNSTHTYWFKAKQNRALCFNAEGTNPFIKLFEDQLEEGKVFLLNGGFHTRVQDGVYFYQGKCSLV